MRTSLNQRKRIALLLIVLAAAVLVQAPARAGVRHRGAMDEGGTGAGRAAVLVHIDKSSQTMSVAVNGTPTYHWAVSTGAPGYSTPSGSFTATSMNEIWYSKQYDNAPMPHAVFFMRDGHAIHGTYDVRNLGRPASHGCVRLAPKNAATLFALVKRNGLQNTHVVVSGESPGGEYGAAGGHASPPGLFPDIFGYR